MRSHCSVRRGSREHSAAHDQDAAAMHCRRSSAGRNAARSAQLHIVIIWLEKRADLALPRLVVKSVRARIVDEDIDNFLNTMKDVTARTAVDGLREFCVYKNNLQK